LRCVAEKNATTSAELAKTLSLFAVDLSVSNRLQHPEAVTAVACDDRNSVANPSGSSEIVDNGASGCSQPTGVAAVVGETFLLPMSHSTPIRDLQCRRNFRCSFSTGGDSNNDSEDDDDEEDDLPVNDFLYYCFFIFYPSSYSYLFIISRCILYRYSFQSRFVDETKYMQRSG